MALHRAFIHNNKRPAFTLIEIAIAMALFFLITSSVAFVSLRSFMHSSLEDEEMLIVSLLEKSRSEAMNGMCGNDCNDPHGIHISDSEYTLFEGLYFMPDDIRNRTFAHLASVSAEGASVILFAPGSGNATFIPDTATSVILITKEASMTVSVSKEGMIDWSL